MNRISEKMILLFSLGIALGLVFMGFFILPRVHWGKIEVLPAPTITVTGEAKSQQMSQVASFTAGVNIINDDKGTAISEANKRIDQIISAAKTFGIPPADIKTENLNVYQSEEQYYEGGSQKYRPGQWRVNNSITVKLRDISRASDLANVLTTSGASNVNGPNFTIDDTTGAENALLTQAIRNARQKAFTIAAASGRNLGEIVSVGEGGANNSPIYSFREAAGGGGGPALEPGSQTVYKTVTVVFALE